MSTTEDIRKRLEMNRTIKSILRQLGNPSRKVEDRVRHFVIHGFREHWVIKRVKEEFKL